MGEEEGERGKGGNVYLWVTCMSSTRKEVGILLVFALHSCCERREKREGPFMCYVHVLNEERSRHARVDGMLRL